MSSCTFKTGDRVRAVDFFDCEPSVLVRYIGKTGRVAGKGASIGRRTILIDWDGQNDLKAGGWEERRFELIVPAYEPKLGDTVRVVVEGTVDYLGMGIGPVADVGPHTVHLEAAESVELVKAAERKWRVGDVVVVQFVTAGIEHTYVRGYRDWPGDGQRLTDKQVNNKFDRNLARHVLRDGQPVCE